MNWLWYGFSAVWVIHVVYLFSISARQQKLQSEVQRLRLMLEDRNTSATGS